MGHIVMHKSGYFFFLPMALALGFAIASPAHGKAAESARALIREKPDEHRLVTLAANTHPQAKPANDRGRVADDLPMDHLLLQLKRPQEREQALEQFIDRLHTPGSADYRQWLTAVQFGERFGLAQADLDSLTHWLESHGFKVNVVYPGGTAIEFSGTAGAVRQAFHTEIHRLEVGGTKHIGNMSDPRIPAALAPAVAGIASLHNFHPKRQHRPRRNYTFISGGAPSQAVVPADLATIYNLNPLFQGGIAGQGQTIVVLEDSNLYRTADWTVFRQTFGLDAYPGSLRTIHPPPPHGPNNCHNPGVANGDDGEATLDAEWASAAAPAASIVVASCRNSSTSYGPLLALHNLVNAAGAPPAVISFSYGNCEADNGAAANASYKAAYQQAAARGVSVFVATGDQGAAECDGNTSASHGIGVNGMASTAYNVAVGGTDFADTLAYAASAYWSPFNDAGYGSALSYIPEIPWNDSCAGSLNANFNGWNQLNGAQSFCNSSFARDNGYLTTSAAGGGPSACATGKAAVTDVVGGSCRGYPKPAWQAGVVGIPQDGVRGTPDVSLFAADGVFNHYYVVCWSNLKGGGAPCRYSPRDWYGGGGTSFSTPVMAGIQALVNQATGQRQGNPNYVYYRLAASQYGASGNPACDSSKGRDADNACIFYDVTQGDTAVNCTGKHNCYRPGGKYGVLSTSSKAYAPAYGATVGWDFATGIGTVNAYNLVRNWNNH